MADNKEVRTRNKEEHSTVAGVEVVTRRKRRVVVPPIDETPTATPVAEKAEPAPATKVEEKPAPTPQVAEKPTPVVEKKRRSKAA